MKVLLMYESQRKIVFIPHLEDTSYDAFLIRNAEDFCAPPFIIQYFDKEFQEWCNIDSNYQPTHKDKLQVVQIQKNLPANIQSMDSGVEFDSVNSLTGENSSGSSFASGSSEVRNIVIFSLFRLFFVGTSRDSGFWRQ